MRLADWAERGEFDHQQDRWKMTAGWGGVRLATIGVEDDRWAERGEFECQQSERVSALKEVSRAENLRRVMRNEMSKKHRGDAHSFLFHSFLSTCGLKRHPTVRAAIV